MSSVQLSERECYFAASALRVAAEQYARDAETQAIAAGETGMQGYARVASQFRDQAAEAVRLAQKIEEAA